MGKVTWKELDARGGPYTPEELRVLWDRPGVTQVGANGWQCDTCGAIRGSYTSADVDAYHRERGTFIERVGPEPPQLVGILEGRMKMTQRVVQDIDREITNAHAEIARINEAHKRHMPTGPNQMADPVREERRARELAVVEARIGELKAAREEASTPMAEASDEYIRAFGAWRMQLLEDERAANQPPDPPKRNALERFLAGALKA